MNCADNCFGSGMGSQNECFVGMEGFGMKTNMFESSPTCLICQIQMKFGFLVETGEVIVRLQVLGSFFYDFFW